MDGGDRIMDGCATKPEPVLSTLEQRPLQIERLVVVAENARIERSV